MIISFIKRNWFASHGGTALPHGTTVASPRDVYACLSSLSTGFSLLDRIRDPGAQMLPTAAPLSLLGSCIWRKSTVDSLNML